MHYYIELETMKGVTRQFIVEAKTKPAAIARAQREITVVSRKATADDLMSAGRDGTQLLSDQDVDPAAGVQTDIED